MQKHLEALVRKTAAQLLGSPELDEKLSASIRVEHSKDPAHGDYATNAALVLSKPLKKAPRALAAELLGALPADPRIARTEIAGPGFINFFIAADYLNAQLDAMFTDPRLGVPEVIRRTVVVDYSAPNVAKEMAVHHLRSTVIGDAVVRTLEFLGHHVIRANHIGDWGTQFGMLIAYLEQLQADDPELKLSDFEAFYRAAKQCYDSDEDFARRARHYVVLLQGGDAHCHELWQRLVNLTMEQNLELYRRLDVTLSAKDTMGESLYNDMLPGVVSDLVKKGIATEDQGALVVFLPEFKNKEGGVLGNIVRKSDGGYLYTTTDIACVKYRVEKLHADRILYFTDSRQHQHLLTVWAIARLAGYVPENVSLEHCPFGMMLGKDGKPFKTRSGGTVRLRELLDEAEERVDKLLSARGSELTGNKRAGVIHNVAIGAVKYADLSKNRTTDYMFDWDLMLAVDGNTAPYLQYAYSRICALLRRSGIAPGTLESAGFTLAQSAEQELAAHLTGFAAAVNSVAERAQPHFLCAYLYELAGRFMRFYESCPVLREELPGALRDSRLKLSELTGRVLRQGLNLLGIAVMEQM